MWWQATSAQNPEKFYTDGYCARRWLLSTSAAQEPEEASRRMSGGRRPGNYEWLHPSPRSFATKRRILRGCICFGSRAGFEPIEHN